MKFPPHSLAAISLFISCMQATKGYVIFVAHDWWRGTHKNKSSFSLKGKKKKKKKAAAAVVVVIDAGI